MLNSYTKTIVRQLLQKNYYLQATKIFLIFSTSILLVSCGGGSSTGGSSNSSIDRMIVLGDSLTDAGTFGYKATIQGSAATGVNSAQVFTDLIATNKSLSAPCNYYVGTPDNVYAATFTVNPTSGCTNFSSLGGRVIYRDATSTPTSSDPRGLPVQISTAAAVLGGYTSKDLIIVGAAGNDFADLFGAALAVLTTTGATQTAALSSFGTFVSAIIPAATVNATLASVVDSATLSSALASLGAAYSAGLATGLNSAIESGIINMGGEKIVLYSSAPVTSTPRFAVILSAIEASSGAAAKSLIENLFNDWNATYNLTQESLALSSDKIIFYDVYDALNKYQASPTSYGFSNASDPACPIVGVGAGGPEYDLKTCTQAAAQTAVGANYSTYLFSDNFHPSPFTYTVVASEILSEMSNQGW